MRDGGSMAEISVIVPVYNVAKYLRDCLESIVNQQFHNIEIILVDDGSKDISGDICDEYAKMDERIKVIHKENGGLSEARNDGLKISTSKYVGFVDSDDRIDLDFYSKLYETIQKEKCDIAVAAIQHFSDDKLLHLRNINGERVYSREEAMKELLLSQHISNSVCNKLFKKELFDKINFPVGRLYEDEYVTYKVFDQVDRVSMIKNTCYYYRYNDESITHARFSEREFDRIYASLDKIKFCEEKYPELKSYARCYLVYDCISTLSKMKKYDKRYDQIILNNVRRHLFCYLQGENSMVSKIFAIIAAISPQVSIFCLKVIKKN